MTIDNGQLTISVGKKAFARKTRLFPIVLILIYSFRATIVCFFINTLFKNNTFAIVKLLSKY